MTVIKYYCDTHIDKQVAIQLRQRGVEIVRCQELGLEDASDEEHLQYASSHDMCLLSKDADFQDLHFMWLEQHKNHCGIFLCRDRQHAAIGKIVKTCYEYHKLIEEGVGSVDDLRNQLFEII